MLRRRDFEPGDEIIEEIRSTEDVAELDAWVLRAMAAETIGDVFS